MHRRRAAPGTSPSPSSHSTASSARTRAQNGWGNAARAARLFPPSGEAGNETPEASAQGVQTDGGTWVAPRYTALTVERDGYVSKGCDIRLEFQPNQWVDADCIALVQTCRGLVSEAEGQEFEPNFIGDPARERRAAGGDGWHIDSGGGDVSPVYGVDAREEGTPLTDFGDASFTNHGFGRSTFGDAGRAQRAPAFLTDRPKQSWQPGRAYSLELETAALCTKGADQGTWYGSVRWGCSVSRSGAITLHALEVADSGSASPAFRGTVTRWNQDTAAVMPKDQPNGTVPVERQTTDLPDVDRSIDRQDPQRQHHALRMERHMVAAELHTLSAQRREFVRCHGAKG